MLNEQHGPINEEFEMVGRASPRAAKKDMEDPNRLAGTLAPPFAK